MTCENEPRGPKEEVSTREFFLRLRQRFSIKLIYYPASGIDSTLLTAFEPREVVLLDSDGYKTREEKTNSTIKGLGRYSLMQDKPFVLADYDYAPFKDEVFDAIFFNCNYAQEEGFREMLRTLKAGGLVIFGLIGFEAASDEDLDRLGEEIDLPFMNKGPHEPFTVHQKVR